MRLVAFQIARQLRGDSADEIGGDFHDLRRGCANRRGNFRVNLVPGRRFVAGNVKGFSHSLGLAGKPRETNREIASRGERPLAFTAIGNEDLLPLLDSGRKGVTAAGDWVWD